MDNTSNSSSSFTTTHFMVSFITTALLFMGIIYWSSGCKAKDYSIHQTNTVKEAPHEEGGHGHE